MELVLATGNPNKRQELESLLAELPIIVRSLNEFEPVPDIIEDGNTCQANAKKKALIIAHHTGLLTLADDTGLEVEALDGRPGVYAARYAGEHATYEDNCQKLLEELQGVPLEKRKARFLTAVAVVDPDSQVEIVEGVLEGQITESPRGTEGFGYDPVFEVPELHKTLAELALDQKNQISHRACALNKAKDLLKQKLNQQENVGA